jgi:hypothetical protein
MLPSRVIWSRTRGSEVSQASTQQRKQRWSETDRLKTDAMRPHVKISPNRIAQRLLRSGGQKLSSQLVVPCRYYRIGAADVAPGDLTSQTFDMNKLTSIPTKQPKITSATLCSPRPTPAFAELPTIPPAITTAAVIGACRHIVLTRTRLEEIRTVTASASGTIQCFRPPMSKKQNPTIQPTITLSSRPLTTRRASNGWGSAAATIDAIAHSGLLSLIAFKVNHTILPAMNTFTANRNPRSVL